MLRGLLILTTIGLSGDLASAQFAPGAGGFGANGYQYPFAPAPTPMNFMPNYYNRQTQPLSPYLNMLRGGSPGVNYFYGVRPGLQSGGMMPGMMGGMGMGGGLMGMQQRMGYLPPGLSPEPVKLPTAGEKLPGNALPPSAHPVYYAGATTFRPMPNMPNMAAARQGVLGNSAPTGYTPRRR